MRESERERKRGGRLRSDRRVEAPEEGYDDIVADDS